jgi:hypothetical protein
VRKRELRYKNFTLKQLEKLSRCALGHRVFPSVVTFEDVDHINKQEALWCKLFPKLRKKIWKVGEKYYTLTVPLCNL